MVVGFSQDVWDEQRFEIAVNGASAKFAQNEAMGDLLLRAGNKVLVEASPQDPIWGIGLAVNDPKAAVPSEWDGLNQLGFALMEVRSRLFAMRAGPK